MISPSKARPVTSNTASSRFEDVSSGPHSRKLLGFAAMMSRRKPPSTRVFSACAPPGDGTVTA